MSILKQLIVFISRFGLFNGLQIFYNIKFGSGRVKVPGLKSAIYLRPGSTDAAVFTKIFLYEEYNLPKLKNKDIKVIIDGGANVGLAAIYFTTLYPAATIICVEPDPENHKQLKKNTQLYPNIKPIEGGLWNADTTLRIVNPNAQAWSFEVTEGQQEKGETISAITIEKIKKDFGIDVIDVAKIDIEGSEKELFEANYESWLPSTRFLIIEVHDWKRKGASRAVFSALVKYRFSFSKKGENLIFANEDL